jgi:hypothetical protein
VLVGRRLESHELLAARAALAFQHRLEVLIAHLAFEPQPFGALSGPLALPLQRIVLVVVAAAVFLLVVVAGLDEREGLAGVVHGGSLA